MGYSRNPKVLEGILPQLEPLTRGRPCAWTVEPGPDRMGASRWAYTVRQGLYIASQHPARFPQLAAVASRFTIEIVDDHTVQARVRRNQHAVVETHDLGVTPIQDATPIQGLEDASGMDIPQSVVGPSTAREIIVHWLRVQNTQPSSTAMQFPDATLDDAEMDTLARWAAKRTPRWIVVRQPGTNAVILSPDQPSIPAGVRWKVTNG